MDLHVPWNLSLQQQKLQVQTELLMGRDVHMGIYIARGMDALTPVQQACMAASERTDKRHNIEAWEGTCG